MASLLDDARNAALEEAKKNLATAISLIDAGSFAEAHRVIRDVASTIELYGNLPYGDWLVRNEDADTWW